MDKQRFDQLVELKIINDDGRINSNCTDPDHKAAYSFLEQKTPHITAPVGESVKERVFCYINNINKTPQCPVCGNPVKFLTTGKNRNSYQTYCSVRCARLNKDYNKIWRKAQSTIREKYGVDNISQSSEHKLKKKQTLYRHYGVNNPTQSPEILEARRQNNRTKYDVDYPTQLESVKAKRIITMLDRYGVKTPQESKKIRQRTKKTNNERFGRDSHMQQHIPKDSIEKLNDSSWLIHHHHTLEQTLFQISDMLCVDPTTISRAFSKHNIEVKHFNVSDEEKNLRNFLQRLGVDIQTSCRDIIKPKELDIYIPSHNLAIEFNGLYWHSEQCGKDKWYHYNKWKECQKHGIRLIHIFEDEWIDKQRIVESKLKSVLGVDDRPSVYARNCSVVTVSTKRKREFFEDNHIQGNGPSSINIGLEQDGTLVACMGFIKQKNQHYLNRYATSCRVPGGFSKLLTHFKKEYSWSRILSFADLRWSDGNLYKRTGWHLDKIIPPEYSYISKNKRIHKFNYRRKYLSKRLTTFDPKLSETENCNNNRILRIWDCGKMRFVLNNTSGCL